MSSSGKVQINNKNLPLCFKLQLEDDGSAWHVTSTSTEVFLGGLYNVTMDIETFFAYRPCETKISTYLVLPNEGLRDLVGFLAQVAEHSQKYGIEEICRYHEAYCAPSDVTRQYESEQDCLDYLRCVSFHKLRCLYCLRFVPLRNVVIGNILLGSGTLS